MSSAAPAITTLPELKLAIDDALEFHLPRTSDLAQDLVDAMRYATLGNGKRLRPLLVCTTAMCMGAELEDALAPACALEFMHAYSLIHDDLPAMDDDDLRHGLPSTHIRFGDATAILAGDALQTLAITTMSDAPNLTDRVRLQTVQLLAHASGWKGMVGGQARDMAAENQTLSVSELQALHSAKTGALFTAAVQVGACIGGASTEQYVLLTEFANRIGLGFQIMDDILDVTESTDHLGKPAGSDEKSGKNTYPKLMGLNEAKFNVEELLGEALPLLDRAKVKGGLLGDAAKAALRRNR